MFQRILRKSKRRILRFLRYSLNTLCVILLVITVYSFWYHHRPVPDPIKKELFQGITYTREIRNTPRPLIIHIVEIDLDAPGIELIVTPPNPTDGMKLAAQTASQFLTLVDAQLAINGSGFSPWHSNSPLDYYPHVGDPVNPTGFTMSKGIVYNQTNPKKYPTVYFSKDNVVSIGEPLENAYNAVTGFAVIVKDGRDLLKGYPVEPSNLHPRTALALDKSGRKLMLFLVDGRQPNYSEGVAHSELSGIIVEYGGHNAVNMDGGGSSTLVIQETKGNPQVLNSPIHGKVPPGVQRPIATHIGIYALPLKE